MHVVAGGFRSGWPGWPSPPAPISAPMVAVPTLITAAVLIPARMAREAIGNSIWTSRVHGGRPIASADSRSEGAMSRKPVAVLRTMGSRLYRNSAASAGAAPSPSHGDHEDQEPPSDGIVWMIPGPPRG